MSFAQLKSSRSTKSHKSYVQTSTPSGREPLADDISASHLPKQSEELRKAIEDGLYSDLPKPIAVIDTEDRGRGLTSNLVRTAGSVLISAKPHVAALSTSFLATNCSNCGTSASGLKRCTSCQTVHYCDAACQKKDWNFHKNECKALQRWASEAPSSDVAIPADAVRCLGRLCWRRRDKGISSVWAREVDSMQSHRKSLHPSSHERYAHLAHSLVRYLGLSTPEEIVEFGIQSSEELVDLVSRFFTNSFALTSPSLTPIGVCVSPIIALINHTCDPNAVVVFPGKSKNRAIEEPRMCVVTIKDISPGEEILTSYVDVTYPRAIRRKELLDAQNFNCECTLCTSPPSLDLREALWCPKSCGGMCEMPIDGMSRFMRQSEGEVFILLIHAEDSLVRCKNCKTLVSPQNIPGILDAIRIGQDALDKATALQSSDPAYALRLTSKIIPILTSAGLTNSSHPLLAMLRLQQYLQISSLDKDTLNQETLDDTIRTASRVSTGLRALLPFGHPVRAVQLAELGKILAVDEPSPTHLSTSSFANDTSASVVQQHQKFPPSGPARLQLALDTLIAARAELLRGFGPGAASIATTGNSNGEGGGEVGEQVREHLVAIEKELSVWKQGVRNTIEDTPGGAVLHKSS